MKSLYLCVFTVCFTLPCAAQLTAFTKGQLEARAGIGFISTLNATVVQASGGNATMKFTSPPLSASVEYGITDEISVGGFVGVAQTSLNMYGGEYEKDKFLFIGPRGSYHFDLHPKFDTYAGAGLYYGRVSATLDDGFRGIMTDTQSDVYYQLFAGATYRFTETIGLFAEVGYGITLGTVGLTVKFK